MARTIDEMEDHPFAGDVKPLKGAEWKGRYRKRVGPYRIIFAVNHTTFTAAVSAILIQSEKTYLMRKSPTLSPNQARGVGHSAAPMQIKKKKIMVFVFNILPAKYSKRST
jgi:mRNA-degrading endonuclease RelE of RelBE toxin-antitoxin system